MPVQNQRGDRVLALFAAASVAAAAVAVLVDRVGWQAGDAKRRVPQGRCARVVLSQRGRLSRLHSLFVSAEKREIVPRIPVKLADKPRMHRTRASCPTQLSDGPACPPGRRRLRDQTGRRSRTQGRPRAARTSPGAERYAPSPTSRSSARRRRRGTPGACG